MNDSWVALRRFTQARIALGRAGHAVPTAEMMAFQLAHAVARDAVHTPWDVDACAEQIRAAGENVLILNSHASSREEYLRRPDLGRMLSALSRSLLLKHSVAETDVVLIVTNGLSSTAVVRHIIPLLQAILSSYREYGLRLSPICLVENGRVALSDDIGSALSARLAVIIVGERPGLSAADSLGIYLTYSPQQGNSDAHRNCISNIRPPEGLGYPEAAAKLLFLTTEALRRGLSGVTLKDEANGNLSVV